MEPMARGFGDPCAAAPGTKTLASFELTAFSQHDAPNILEGE